MVNATESEQKFDLNVAGVHIAGRSTLWDLAGNSLDSANRVGQPPQVEVKETAIGDAPHLLAEAPTSVTIYRFPVAH